MTPEQVEFFKQVLALVCIGWIVFNTCAVVYIVWSVLDSGRKEDK